MISLASLAVQFKNVGHTCPCQQLAPRSGAALLMSSKSCILW